MSRRIQIALAVGVLFALCAVTLASCTSFAGVILQLLTPSLNILQHPQTHELLTSTLPITLSWQYKTAANPIIVGSTYATASVYLREGDDLLALNPDDHTLLWRMSRKVYFGFGSVVPSADMVLATDDYGTVLKALQASDGHERWSVDLQKIATWPGTPRIMSILPDSDLVFAVINMTKGTQAIAVQRATGALVWKTRGNLQAWPTSVAFTVDGDLAVYTIDYLYRLDRSSGRVIRKDPLRIPSRDDLVAADAVIYSNGQHIDAIDGRTRLSKWVFTGRCHNSSFGIPWAPTVTAHTVYVSTSCGLFYAVDAGTGRVKWIYGSESGPTAAGFAEYQGYGYLLTSDMKLHALELASGSEVGSAVFTPAWLPSVRTPEVPFLAVGGNLLLLNPGTQQVFAFTLKR